MGRVGEVTVPTVAVLRNSSTHRSRVEWREMDEPFSNDPIPVDHLPRLSDDAFVSVDRRYVWGSLAGVVVTALVVVVVIGLIVRRTDSFVVPVAVGVGIVAVLVAIGVVLVVESRRLAYQLHERDLSLRSGAIRHRVETIPFSRVQHVSVGRGLVERSLGLATLQVSSAGPDLSVPGLSPADRRADQGGDRRSSSHRVRDRRRAGRRRRRAVAAAVASAVIDLTEPQRQSPFAIVMLGVRLVRSLGIVQLVVAIAVIVRWAADGRLLVAIVVAGALFLTLSALSWWRYTFRFVDDELVVTSGVLRAADRLTVPIDRIQSIAVEQELLHRVTGLVKVVIDTAGSSQAEFTIDAVARPVADELRRRVGAGGVVATADRVVGVDRQNAAERIVFQHDATRLVVAALTMSPWAGLAVLVPLLAVSQELLEPIGDRLSDAAPDVSVDSLAWWSVPPVVVAGLLCRGGVEPGPRPPHRLATGAAHRPDDAASYLRPVVADEHLDHPQPGAGDDLSPEPAPAPCRASRCRPVERRYRRSAVRRVPRR